MTERAAKRLKGCLSTGNSIVASQDVEIQIKSSSFLYPIRINRAIAIFQERLFPVNEFGLRPPTFLFLFLFFFPFSSRSVGTLDRIR